MMLPLFIILGGLSLSWYLIDLASESVIGRVLAPLGLTLFFIALALWIVFRLHSTGIKQTSDSSGGGFGADGFGDGGGGD
jgi:hypothetical protein